VSRKLYLILSGAIFFLVALLHLFRLVYHWPIVVGTFVVPHFVSYIGFPVAAGYCLWAYWLVRK